jgi:hypothetical protein
MAVSMVDVLTATVDSYFIFYRDTTTNPKVFNMGHYHDTVRREDGEWRLDRRVITIG